MLNKSSGKPLERLGTSRVTFTFDDSSLAFRPFTAIHCSSLHEEEVTVEKERFHFLPDELRTAYQAQETVFHVCIIQTLFSWPTQRERWEPRRSSSELHRVESDVICNGTLWISTDMEWGKQKGRETLCGLWHKWICLNILCHFQLLWKRGGFKMQVEDWINTVRITFLIESQPEHMAKLKH